MPGDPFAQLYPFSVPQGPSLSGLPANRMTLSGMMSRQPGAIGANLPGGSEGLTAIASLLSPSRAAPRSGGGATISSSAMTSPLNPILAALNPMLIGGSAGVMPRDTSGIGPFDFAPLNTQLETQFRLLLDQLRAASGQPTVGQEQQAASGSPGATAAIASQRERAPINPMSLLPLLQNLGTVGFGLIGGPGAPGGLATGSAGLSALGSLADLTGANPDLALALKAAGLGGRAIQTGQQLTTAAQTAGAAGGAGRLLGGAGSVLGLAGSAAGLAGVDPRIASSLSLAGSLAGVPSAVSALSAAGAGPGAASLAPGALGPTLALGGIPWAIGSVFKAFTDADKARRFKEAARDAQQAFANVKTNEAATNQALDVYRRGDLSGIPQIAESLSQAIIGKGHAGYSTRGLGGNVVLPYIRAITTIAATNPAGYTQLIGATAEKFRQRFTPEQQAFLRNNVSAQYDVLYGLGFTGPEPAGYRPSAFRQRQRWPGDAPSAFPYPPLQGGGGFSSPFPSGAPQGPEPLFPGGGPPFATPPPPQVRNWGGFPG